MIDKIFWKYLEELPEQETAFYEWHQHLADWHCFNTFYTHYMKVGEKHAKFLDCTTSCNYGCPRQVVENTYYDIAAVCPQGKAAPIKLKFKDILICSVRREEFHKALCVSLQIEQTSGSKLSECKHAWYLGEHSGTAVYLTYRATELTETISLLCQLLRKVPFILIVPTIRGITLEAQELLSGNHADLLSMTDELTLQPDGTFSSKHSMSECIKSYNHSCLQADKKTTLPIETYKYLVYKKQ